MKYILAGLFFGFVAVKSEVVSWFRILEMFHFDSFSYVWNYWKRSGNRHYFHSDYQAFPDERHERRANFSG